MVARPVRDCFFNLSNSGCGNTGLKSTSAIKSKTLPWCFFNEEAETEVAEAFKLAPMKSISWSSWSLVLFLVPPIIISPMKVDKPALSPSKIGSLSNTRVKETRGSLLFFTTNTFKPLASVKVSASLILISGAGPEAGNLLRSTWAKAIPVARNVTSNPIAIFFMSIRYVRSRNYSAAGLADLGK